MGSTLWAELEGQGRRGMRAHGRHGGGRGRNPDAGPYRQPLVSGEDGTWPPYEGAAGRGTRLVRERHGRPSLGEGDELARGDEPAGQEVIGDQATLDHCQAKSGNRCLDAEVSVRKAWFLRGEDGEARCSLPSRPGAAGVIVDDPHRCLERPGDPSNRVVRGAHRSERHAPERDRSGLVGRRERRLVPTPSRGPRPRSAAHGRWSWKGGAGFRGVRGRSRTGAERASASRTSRRRPRAAPDREPRRAGCSTRAPSRPGGPRRPGAAPLPLCSAAARCPPSRTAEGPPRPGASGFAG